MRRIIFLLTATACSLTNGLCQKMDLDKNFSLRIGLSLQLSSATANMKDHLKESGFGDKFNSSFDALHDGNDYYPQSQTISTAFEIAFERKVGKLARAGIMVGIDQIESVKGYDRYGTGGNGTYSIGQFLTLEHTVWFLSPQFSMESENGKIGFYAGPSIDFHSLSVKWENKRPIKKNQSKIGALLGVRAKIVGGLQGFAAFRYTSSLGYEESTSNVNNETSTLPAKKINFNHLRLGLSYRFSF